MRDYVHMYNNIYTCTSTDQEALLFRPQTACLDDKQSPPIAETITCATCTCRWLEGVCVFHMHSINTHPICITAYTYMYYRLHTTLYRMRKVFTLASTDTYKCVYMCFRTTAHSRQQKNI